MLEAAVTKEITGTVGEKDVIVHSGSEISDPVKFVVKEDSSADLGLTVQKTPAEALAAWTVAAEPCSGVAKRTQVVKILNSSECSIVIAFQRLDSSYVPAGYESTTGVYPALQQSSPSN